MQVGNVSQGARQYAGAAIDRQPLTAFHWKLLGVAGIGWMFDAMDVGLITFVLPVLGAQWKLAPDLRGLILSAGFLGMFVGAAVAGMLADRLGRKVVFQSTLAIFAVATGLSALIPAPVLPAGVPANGVDLAHLAQYGSLATSVWMLLGLRFLVGLGLGGELPVASTLVSEWAPAGQRGRMMVLLESFWAYGWILAAGIALVLLPATPPSWHIDGWRIAFALGALPALYTLSLRRSLPESPRYLESRGQMTAARVALQEAGLHRGLDTTVPPPLAGRRVASGGLGLLWRGTFARRTAMLWVLWFGMVFSYYGIFSWLPTLMTQHSSLVRGFQYTFIITLAQVPGYFSAAWLVERWGRKPTLVTYLVGSATGALLYGYALVNPSVTDTWLVFAGCVVSFFNLGAWGVVYTYTPEQYPTAVRGSGSGWAAAVGRLGGIFGPYVPGLWLGAGLGQEGLFAVFTAVFLIIAAAVFALGTETRGQRLEEITNE
ncbi:MAG TPA: MFS transporter [Chloroflexia bacterium]|nr:MFS transporter [Chloroflexia bacterium]